jgi:hypothetical protein
VGVQEGRMTGKIGHDWSVLNTKKGKSNKKFSYSRVLDILVDAD